MNFHCKSCSAFSLLPHTRPPCILEFLGDLYCNLLGRFYAQTCKRNDGMLTNSRRCVLLYYIINIEAIGTWQGCIANVLIEPIFSCIREAKYSSKLVKLQQEPLSKIVQQTLNTGIYGSAMHTVVGYLRWSCCFQYLNTKKGGE